MESWKDIFIWLAVGVGSVYGIVSCTNSDWHKAYEANSEKQRIKDETPHVIRYTNDGCKVYASGSWHYFTRCGATTTTEKNWTENCGKNCTRRKQESIVTSTDPTPP